VERDTTTENDWIRTENKRNKTNPNTITRGNNQNYSATQNPGFVPQPLTQHLTELLQQSCSFPH